MTGGVYEASAISEIAKRHCFAVLVDDEPGVLARVAGLFSGRGYNIESLTVDVVDPERHLSRITIAASGTPMVIEQIKAQLGRLVPVRQVVDLTTQGRFVEGCLAYVKLTGNFTRRDQAKLTARSMGARIVDITDDAIIFELCEAAAKIDQFIAALKPLGPLEVARTGSVAIACGETVLALPDPLAERRSA